MSQEENAPGYLGSSDVLPLHLNWGKLSFFPQRQIETVARNLMEWLEFEILRSHILHCCFLPDMLDNAICQPRGDWFESFLVFGPGIHFGGSIILSHHHFENSVVFFKRFGDVDASQNHLT